MYALHLAVEDAARTVALNKLCSSCRAADHLFRRTSKHSDTARPLILKDMDLDADCEKVRTVFLLCNDSRC